MPKDEFAKLTDEELVAHCIKHKRRYQEALYRRYADDLYAVALIYCKSDQDAADVLQESFIKIFKNLERFKFQAALKSWMRRILVNTALDHYRKRKREKAHSENYQQQQELKVDDILSRINAAELLELLNQLPKKAGMVLKLYAIEGYAHKEIAEQMQISEGTSKSQLSRARSLLKELLSKLQGDV